MTIDNLIKQICDDRKKKKKLLVISMLNHQIIEQCKKKDCAHNLVAIKVESGWMIVRQFWHDKANFKSEKCRSSKICRDNLVLRWLPAIQFAAKSEKPVSWKGKVANFKDNANIDQIYSSNCARFCQYYWVLWAGMSDNPKPRILRKPRPLLVVTRYLSSAKDMLPFPFITHRQLYPENIE